jgi:hypothetical protein
MRSVSLVLLSLGFVLGCGGSTKDPVASGGGGTGAQGGIDSGGAGSGGSAEAGTASGGVASSSGAPSGGADPLVDCDERKVTCRRAPPPCGTFEVPAVDGACYGECVKIERCACSGPEQCPDSNQFTCWSKTHCGPYVH